MFDFVVFLDFDGVLHRGTTGTVRHAPALAQVVLKFPYVQVVISSTWRLQNTLTELKQWLPTELTARVIDVTPSLERGAYQREKEVLAWLAVNPTRAWLALDDEAALFSPGCPFLLQTNGREGLTPENLQELEQRIRASS